MLSERFMKEIEERLSKGYVANKESGCWIWQSINNGRYGLVYIPSLKKSLYSHRVSYMLKSGEEIPEKMLVCHKCDVMACMNPDHLFLGTSKDNQQDMKNKGRSLAGIKNGHATFCEDDVLEIYKLLDEKRTYKFISIKFNVSSTHIRRIALGHSWQYLHKQRRGINESA